MVKTNDEFDSRINEFYQYLEQRLEIQEEIDKQINFDKTSKSDKIIFKKDGQPIPSIYLIYLNR